MTSLTITAVLSESQLTNDRQKIPEVRWWFEGRPRHLPVSAMTNEMTAARRSILTSKSSNDSLILSQRDSSSSFSSWFGPCFASSWAAYAEVSPRSRLVLRPFTTSSTVYLWYWNSLRSSLLKA
jgi:hypothetical protein